MPVIQLADVYTPLTFNRRAQEAQEKLNVFLSSGIASVDSLLGTMLSGGANIVELPQFNAITAGEPNYSTDDPASFSTPAKIGTQFQKARSASRNKSWSAMDLARELTDADPMGAVTSRVGAYWATDDEKRLIQSALGILADNVANDGGDMVKSVSTDAAGAVVDAERISSTNVVLATQTLGDHKQNLSAIAMHSVQHSRLQIQGLLLDNFDPETKRLSYQTYLGHRVIVDDSLPAVAGANRLTYTCILFAEGAFSYAKGNVLTPSEIERVAGAGDGGGQTVIHSRINTCYHANGFEFLSGSVAGKSPTYAELANAANWSRVVARKNVPMAFLKVND
jgi:hypothetical protein